MKRPKFFCDNCGEEVVRNEKSCPNCGRFFSNIRCPKCAFSGEEHLFKNGCPECGYSNVSLKKQAQNKNIKLYPAGKLPCWVLVAVILAFIAAIAALVMVVK
jgi:predicted RNA-binding Zn-ribbon protein involved in translation (DUF1610 family)